MRATERTVLGVEPDPRMADYARSTGITVEAFAVLWDELPIRITGRPDYRDLITTTRLVYSVRVRGQLSPLDDAIELTDIVLDLQAPHPDGIDDPDL